MNISESLLAQGENVSKCAKLTNIFNKLIHLRNATNNNSTIRDKDVKRKEVSGNIFCNWY